MARRAKQDAEGVSLFPFLSILACVIGVLTLMITALALSQMDNPEGQAAERADKYKHVQEVTEDKREDLAKLKALVAQAEMIRNAREELERLKQTREKATSDKKQSIELLAKSNTLGQRIDEIKDEPAQLKEQVDKLDAELKRRKEAPKEATVTIRPGGSGSDFDPTFVECTPSGIVIHEGDEPRRVRRNDIAKDEEFLVLLNKISLSEKRRLIFLVRDDGVGTYNHTRWVARNNYCLAGKLPILGQGFIDLSIFKQGR